MFEITEHIEQEEPNAFAKAERERPWVSRKRRLTKFVLFRARLKDGSREHGKYVVLFAVWGKRYFADCINVLTGEPCKGEEILLSPGFSSFARQKVGEQGNSRRLSY